ncbi:MAG: bifunctional 1-(5-phosphoribosyl)-5-((5-phosphoribosylamino)methylideneamino)imidazole-4-carboxamide isomerase/phosphoribosylanthranilate isomerase PriA, partial [Gammaproteobacteria bacterium]|nr:bifunctional 1-(5-phosphoribosyl)-5-((5-phosphoribosylamino)methylideneamino)imidazole-4-carboxamide isomerase/phosphoribosylanthranilate isomerase PriA [Gammaproteobacteria bacterium]
SRDGTLTGTDLLGLAGMLDAVDIDVVASGGVGSIEDLQALASIEGGGGRRLTGAIVGTALYERRFTVAEAAAALAGPGGGG